eukprot:scaffold98419_cov64-Phaeocystis_antarctica.AAC.3
MPARAREARRERGERCARGDAREARRVKRTCRCRARGSRRTRRRGGRSRRRAGRRQGARALGAAREGAAVSGGEGLGDLDGRVALKQHDPSHGVDADAYVDGLDEEVVQRVSQARVHLRWHRQGVGAGLTPGQHVPRRRVQSNAGARV